MAISGIVFIGFVLVHMYGNLKAFSGHDAFNEYAHHLRTFGEPMLPHEGLLWIIRVVLLGALVVHVYAAVDAVAPRQAAPARTPYAVKKHTGAIFASRLMRWGGVTLLLFIIWHLLNFTIGKVNVTGGADQRPVQPAGRHVRHVVADADLPLRDARARRAPAPRHLERRPDAGPDRHRRGPATWKKIAFSVALVISVGFSLVPIFVLAGVISK